MLLWPLVTGLGLSYEVVARQMTLGEIAQAHAVLSLKSAYEEQEHKKATPSV